MIAIRLISILWLQFGSFGYLFLFIRILLRGDTAFTDNDSAVNSEKRFSDHHIKMTDAFICSAERDIAAESEMQWKSFDFVLLSI